MPRIPQNIIDSVFFLYHTKADAEKGVNAGGTGFIVSVDGVVGDDHKHHDHYYAVTNHHVITQDEGYPVIRLNTQNGGVDIFEYGPEDWEFLPGNADVAVLPIDLADDQHEEIRCISRHLFAFAGGRSFDDISVGDDVFMLGLFVDHEGKTTNNPKARFGNISMMPSPSSPIEQTNGYLGESYIVDMHSRSGFSGSPVFVFRTPFGEMFSDRFYSRETTLRGRLDVTHINQQIAKANTPQALIRSRTGRPQVPDEVDVRIKVWGSLFKFLGIHWGQFPEYYELKYSSAPFPPESKRREVLTDGTRVKGNSGMTCVIPSWKIAEVLDMPKLKKQREEQDARHKRKPDTQVMAESVQRKQAKDQDANPDHKKDFENLLDAAVKPTQSGD